MPKVFVSATSGDLKSYRQVVAEWAKLRGYEPVVQDEFPVQSDYGTIVQMLRDKLAPCDAVIHLAGLYYGFEPSNAPAGEQRRSYTQLEYELGKELRRQVFRFIARENYQPDKPITQTAEQQELQRVHRERLTRGSELYSATSRTTGNELYYEFSSVDELRRLLDLIKIRDTVSKPVNLPFSSLGSLFKGRDQFLEQLRRVLVEKPTHIAAVTGKQAIHGLGGVGKTRAAIEYGWKYHHEYTALLFVTADSPANLERNLADLCGAMVLNLPEQHATEQEAQVAAAVRWLREHAGWFLVLDNVDTAEAFSAAEELLTQVSSGHVVVTSRLSDWGSGVESLELDVLDHAAARDFLLERTQNKRRNTATDFTDAEGLAQDVDGLALALEQAGAFIVKHRISLAEYRTRWRQHDAKVLEWFDQRTMKYPRSVATTWQTSIDELGPDGRQLLNILCWLAADPIPRDMIDKLSKQPDEPAIDVEAALADITTYSLARWQSDGDAIQVHRLVEEITQYRLPADGQSACLVRALGMVHAFFPFDADDVRYWPTCQMAQPHALSVTKHAQAIGNPSPSASLLNQLGVYFSSRAEHQSAERVLRRALAIDEQSFGPHHPKVAIRLNNLAQLLQATNRLEDAEPLMRRALAIDEQPFGPHHPKVAIDLNNLAQLLKATNRLADAEPLMRRALAIDEQSFGPHHPNVAIDLNNLATLLHATNRLEDAEPLMRRALAIDEQSFGPHHPNVAIDLNNLAQLLKATNRLADAEPLMRRALAIDEQSFGPHHPNVAIDLNNLATLLQATNRLADAEPLMSRHVTIFCQFTRATSHFHPNLRAAIVNYWEMLAEMMIPEAERFERLVAAGVDLAWLDDSNSV
jgi:tetratricopeptide (TPR) repeat protein